MSIFSDRIKKERENLGLTRENFANKVGVSYSAIAMYEQGNREPNNEIMLKMCEIFDCSMDYLTGLSSYKNFRIQLNSNLKSISILDKLLPFDIERLEKIINGAFNSEGEMIKNEKYIEKIYVPSYLSKEEVNFLIDDLCNHYMDYYCLYPLKNGSHAFSATEFKEMVRFSFLENLSEVAKINSNNCSVSNLSLIPVLGKIAAGQPILAEERIEDYFPVDPKIYGLTTSEDLFYLLVSGDSMNQKVESGDYVLVHKQDYAKNGDIIVAIVNDDNEATLKRYKEINNQYVQLEPMSNNPIHQTRTIDLKTTKFLIIGKAIGKFGKF